MISPEEYRGLPIDWATNREVSEAVFEAVYNAVPRAVSLAFRRRFSHD